MIDLEGLREYRVGLDRDRASYFLNWPIGPEVREVCWKTLADCVDELIALGPAPAEGAAEDVLRRCVEAYNELDDGFITTLEREDLCRVLYDVGDLCGIDPDAEWVEDYREW